jgi:hypothetical protein
MALDPRFTQTMDDAVRDPGASQYDVLIQRELLDYSQRLGTTGLPFINWNLIKAMVLVESGGPKNLAWRGRAMQIGNPNDKGYAALVAGEGASEQVMSDSLKKDLKTGNINTPELNIRAGIAYLLVRLARVEPEYSNGGKTVVRKIKSWRPVTLENIAHTYNVGDHHYAEKLRYVLSLLEPRGDFPLPRSDLRFA